MTSFLTLVGQYSDENLDFVTEVEIFEKMFLDGISNEFSSMHVKILKDQAQKIETKYLGANSLNLSFALRRDTRANVSQLLQSEIPSPSMKSIFTEAKDSILELLKSDSHVRFEKSPLFQQFQKSIYKTPSSS